MNFLNKVLKKSYSALENFPDLNKLVCDISNVFISNKTFIFYSLRIYFYLTLLVYAFTFVFLTISLMFPNESLIKPAIIVLEFYNL